MNASDFFYYRFFSALSLKKKEKRPGMCMANRVFISMDINLYFFLMRPFSAIFRSRRRSWA